MRTTQYIGLTQRAEEFVAGLEQLDPDTETEGMFGEVLRLRKWLSPDSIFPSSLNVREVVQEQMMSGGVMIFTCLEVEYNNGRTAQFCEWVHDPTVRHCGEFDKGEGVLWV
jgi:hypothetical protein